MWSQSELSQQIRDTLLTYDPDISLDVGTPERKIVDAISAVLASVQVDQFVTTYSNDINSKFGTDLDDYVSMFGLSRQAARSSVGYITFSLGSNAQNQTLIPANTLVSSPAGATSSQVSFITKNDVVIAVNTNSVEAIVQCVIPGSIGNVPAGAISAIVSGVNNSIANITKVTNLSPITGGVDQETDAQLKVRFQNTIMRNIGGTLDQFLGLTLANSNVNKATAIGPISTFSEYVQIGPTGVVTSTNTSAQYIYNTNYYVNSDGTDSSVFYNPGTVTLGSVVSGDYIWTYGGVQSPTDSDDVAAQITFNAVTNPAPIYPGTVLPPIAGNLSGVYDWSYSFVYNPGGESPISPIFPGNGQPLLSQNAQLAIPVGNTTSLAGGSVVARNIYRSSDGGVTWGYVNSLYDNLSLVFTDSYLDTSTAPLSLGLSSASVVFLNYEYISENSRNYINDASGINITNKIDIYASGVSQQNATDVLTGPGIQFAAGSVNKYYYNNYRRGYSTALPNYGGGNSFMQLTWTPVTSLPDQLVVNGITYNQGNAIDYDPFGVPVPGTAGDYWLVKDITVLRDSIQARDGVELSSSMAAAVGASIFSLDYTFDDIPLTTQNVVDQHKQIGQDVLVHLAAYRYFRIYLVAIYENGMSKASTDQAISSALNSWFTNNQVFGSTLEPNSILQQVLNTTGVISARFATIADNSSAYGIQEVDNLGNYVAQFDATVPIFFEDIEIPVFYDLGPSGPVQKSINTWNQ